MANEFKVRKGLIVEGSGSAVLDIQGSQGQLFSITDDLTGDIFSVSDISGVPILNVNADGTTTFDGTLKLTTDETLDTTSDTSIKFLTRDSNGIVKYHSLGSNAFNSTGFTTNTGTLTGNGSSTYIPFYSGATTFSNTNKLTWDGSYLLTAGLKIAIQTALNSEATSLMINSSGIVGTRELGSNAFNSTAFTTNTGTLTGNGSSGRVPIYNGTTSFTTDGGFTYSSNILSIDGVLRANGVPIIDHSTERTLLIGDTDDGDEIDIIKFQVMAGVNMTLEDGETAINSAFKLPSMSNQSSEATSLMINSSGIVGTRELGTSAFTGTTTADGNYGLYMSGTTVRMEDDRRRNSTSTDIYTGNTHDYVFFDASHGMRFYTSGAEEMRLEDDGDLHVDGDIIAFSSTVSDERLKDNVTTIENPLDKIKALRGVEYDWNDGSRKGKHDLGLIAQEVEKVIPNIVHEHKMPLLNDDEEDETLYKTVDYEKLTAVLIEGMKEQQSQIDSLKSELAKIKGSL